MLRRANTARADRDFGLLSEFQAWQLEAARVGELELFEHRPPRLARGLTMAPSIEQHGCVFDAVIMSASVLL